MSLNPHALIPIVLLGLSSLACAQDCELVTRLLSGFTHDADGNPVEGATIHIYSGMPDYYGGNGTIAPDIILSSDAGGYFETSLDIFLCDQLMIQVSADGFEASEFQYMGWAGTAAYNQSYGNLDITLERTP